MSHIRLVHLNFFEKYYFGLQIHWEKLPLAASQTAAEKYENILPFFFLKKEKKNFDALFRK